jgi:hypothetical protein
MRQGGLHSSPALDVLPEALNRHHVDVASRAASLYNIGAFLLRLIQQLMASELRCFAAIDLRTNDNNLLIAQR